ncbi:nickel ABC transporter, nickel/metallophore periplasmic binding protein [Clostridium formicaceticum]|nr:nickel ABC transporter, nickel/metallophore periplasmic binding protein [Clostridium formicaceticum]
MILIAVVLCISLVGCNREVSSSETNSNELNELIMASPQDNYDINPHLYAGTMSIQGMVFEALVENTEDGIKPLLAESWDVSEDGKTYTFYLRENVTFHDGEVFNAEVAKLNIDAVLRNKEMHTWSKIFEIITGCDVINEYTLQVTLAESYYPFLTEMGLTRPFRFISPKCFIDGETMNGVNGYAGTGAYVLVEDVADQYAVFEAYENYWGGEPKIKKVTRKVLPIGQTTILALQKGDINFLFTELGGDALDAEALMALNNDDRYQIVRSDPMYTKQLFACTGNTDSPISEKLVRQAVWYGIDRETIASVIANNLETPAYTMFSKNIPYANIALEKRGYSIEKSIELLEQAGWKLEDGQAYRTKNGKPLEINVYYASSKASQKAVCELMQSTLAEAGIKLNLVGEEALSIRERRLSENYELLMDSTFGKPYDPQSTLMSKGYLLAAKGIPGIEEVYAKIDAIVVTTDETERQELYAEVLTKFHDEACFIPLTYSTVTIVAPANLQNITFRQTQYEIPLEKMYFQ